MMSSSTSSAAFCSIARQNADGREKALRLKALAFQPVNHKLSDAVVVFQKINHAGSSRFIVSVSKFNVEFA